MKVLQTAYSNYIEHVRTREFPDCFETKQQFELWMEMEALVHTKPRAFPCRDCSPAFQQQQAALGNCANAGVRGMSRIMAKDTVEAPQDAPETV